MKSKAAVVAVCGATVLGWVPQASADTVLAQFSQSNRSSSSSSYRANRGMIKLGVFAVVAIGALISRVLRSDE
jgi:hypothetical protein